MPSRKKLNRTSARQKKLDKKKAAKKARKANRSASTDNPPHASPRQDMMQLAEKLGLQMGLEAKADSESPGHNYESLTFFRPPKNEAQAQANRDIAEGMLAVTESLPPQRRTGNSNASRRF